ncbi:MAG: hypothetical protein IPL99_15805 [Candidatus Competibacteraceae bacterium]|nr:hypothetical protein [Candidatus Competibacteraceae bacterium]
MDMIEMRSTPEIYRLKSTGVYVAGFNEFVDYVIFPLMMMCQMIGKGLLRHFWANSLIWGINNLSGDEGTIAAIPALLI